MAGYGALIREAREAQGLTQEELADRVGVSRGTMGHIERELVGVEAEMFVRLCQELRGLKPIALLNAMGFVLGASATDQLPPTLVRTLLSLGPDDLLVVERVARGLQQEPANRRQRVRP